MKNIYKIGIISVVGFISTLLIFFLLIKPNLSQVRIKNANAVTKKTELRTLEDQITAYRNARNDLSQASDKDSVNNSVLRREDLELAIKEIESAATTTNTLEVLNIDDADNGIAPKQNEISEVISGKKQSVEVPYTLSATNNFSGIVQFMSYLEHLPHFTEVSKFSLSATSGDLGRTELVSHSGTVVGTIEGVFFIKKIK